MCVYGLKIFEGEGQGRRRTSLGQPVLKEIKSFEAVTVAFPIEDMCLIFSLRTNHVEPVPRIIPK